jgi:hypothetical protein
VTRRRVLVLIAAGAGLVALAVVVFATGAFGGGSPAASSSDNGFPTSRTTVKRETLTSQTQVSATLGFGDTGTIVAPSGTAPSAVDQARQAATTAGQQLATARTTAAADTAALTQARAAVAADRQKLSVDCAGDAAGSAAASSTTGGGGGDASPCASDAQTLSADQQTEVQAAGKAASDAQGVASAAAGSASASAAVTAAVANETFYGQSSTFTGLPVLGTVVGRGQTLYEIDGQPVSLLDGSVAVWRAFVAGMSPGRDVAELNANLRALGYAAPLGDSFTAATASAIDAFQTRLGDPQTGALLLGSVVFEPHRVRVTAVTPTVGATVQPGPVLSVTSTRRVVTIQLDAADQNQVKVGDEVSITLPDNSTTPGKVTYVGTVATTPSDSGDNGGGSSTPTIEVDVTPTDPAATGRLDQAPVLVSITEATAKNALVVPVDALLALGSGGYAVEEVGAGGVHHLVGVQTGLFDDASGQVQVTGPGIAVGQKIVVPNE